MSFFSFLLKKKFPDAVTLSRITTGELTLARSILYGIVGGILIVLYIFIIRLNDKLLVTVPAPGGTITLGVIGAPRFINPILSATSTDRSLTRLVYAGLMKELADGSLVPELASGYEISPDGRTYTFTLRDKVVFSDATPVTSSDVAFTIQKMQDEALNPQKAVFWKGVVFSTPDERTISLSLPAVDAGFLQKMSFGVLEQSQWQGVVTEAFIDPSLNLSPVGAGPFSIDSISRSDTGAPEKIIFIRNKHYPLGSPLLNKIEVSIYANQEKLLSAIQSGTIDLTFDLLPDTLAGDIKATSFSATPIPTTNTLALYRKSSEASLGNAALLALLNRYVDKKSILDTVENGYGIPAESPNDTTRIEGTSPTLEEAQSALAKLGYKVANGTLIKGNVPVSIDIATLSDESLVTAAKALANQLAVFGVVSEVQAFDLGTFQDELDKLAFPLVLADNSIEVPSNYTIAIPLYTDAVIATATPDVHGISMRLLQSPDLIFADVSKWHKKTDRVYPFLRKKNNSTEEQ